MKLACVVALLFFHVTLVFSQTDNPGAGGPGGKGGPGGRGPPPLAAALQPLGLQQIERMIIHELRSSGKGMEQTRSLADGLASEITQMGSDKSKVLDRIQQFATQNGLSSSVTSAITAAKSG